jgi:hypothetical protein
MLSDQGSRWVFADPDLGRFVPLSPHDPERAARITAQARDYWLRPPQRSATVSHAAPHSYGRLAVRHDPRTLHFANYQRPSLVAPPVRADYASKVTDWPMYLNDAEGDCTVAAEGHMVEAWTAYGQAHEVSVTDADVQRVYERVSGFNPVTGANDNGANELDVLNDWRKRGIGGHKIVAYLRLDVHNHRQVRQAIALFGGIYTGFNVPESAENQFAAGEHWHVMPDATGSNILGGHAVPVLAYDPANLVCITWAKAQPMTWHFWDVYFEEAYAVVTKDFLDRTGHNPAGLDLRQLLADLDALD